MMYIAPIAPAALLNTQSSLTRQSVLKPASGYASASFPIKVSMMSDELPPSGLAAEYLRDDWTHSLRTSGEKW